MTVAAHDGDSSHRTTDVLAGGPLPSMQLGLTLQLAYSDLAHFVPVVNARRFSHTWVLGKSGYGKSTALANWAIEDIRAGDGVAVFDPHGDLVDTILLHVPPERQADKEMAYCIFHGKSVYVGVFRNAFFLHTAIVSLH